MSRLKLSESINMRTKPLLLFATLLLTAGYSSGSLTLGHAAESLRSTAPVQIDGWAAIKTDAGLLLVWNGRGLNFTLAIKGTEVKSLNESENPIFDVDGKVLQIQVVEIESFAPGAREKKLDDRAILAAHRDWEAKYLENLFKSKLTVQAFNLKLSNGSDASILQFDMPESMDADAKKQVYLTIVSKDQVLLLNSVATAATSDSEARKFLTDTIATLKLSPTPIDEKKLAESIRQGTAP
ncbi:MAG TPA: hypothetical protein VGC61_07195 [Pyrinomonadaceae bacterium]|jgi:hypothetical protein